MAKLKLKGPIQYVPIVKSKAGERWTLSHLKASTRAAIRPLLELHEHSSKSNGDHIESLCEDWESVWGGSPFYVDGIWLHDDIGHAATLRIIDEHANGCGMSPIQVVRPDFTNSSLDEMETIVENRKRGYLLRISPDDLANPARVQRVVDAIGVPRTEIDLLIDYRSRAMSLAHDVPLVPQLADWRSLLAASGAFPKSVATLARFTWHRLPRNDWRTWRDAVLPGTLSRIPTYSDYTMKERGAPATGGDPPVSLKYTVDDEWLVRVDGSLQNGEATRMYDICRSLVGLPEFCHAAFSAGDAEIESRATTPPTGGQGAAQQWIQWSMNHHIEFVVNQIAAL